MNIANSEYIKHFGLLIESCRENIDQLYTSKALEKEGEVIKLFDRIDPFKMHFVQSRVHVSLSSVSSALEII